MPNTMTSGCSKLCHIPTVAENPLCSSSSGTLTMCTPSSSTSARIFRSAGVRSAVTSRMRRIVPPREKDGNRVTEPPFRAASHAEHGRMPIGDRRVQRRRQRERQRAARLPRIDDAVVPEPRRGKQRVPLGLVFLEDRRPHPVLFVGGQLLSLLLELVPLHLH